MEVPFERGFVSLSVNSWNPLENERNDILLREATVAVKNKLIVVLNLAPNIGQQFEDLQLLLHHFYSVCLVVFKNMDLVLLDVQILLPSLIGKDKYYVATEDPELQVFFKTNFIENSDILTINQQRVNKGLLPLSQHDLPSILDINTTMNVIPSEQQLPLRRNYPSYPCVALAGTFDHLHVDHKLFLTLAALVASEKLIVGVLTPSPSKKHVELIQPVEHRVKVLKLFLNCVNPTIKYEIPIIEYGGTPEECSLVCGYCRNEVDAIFGEDEPECNAGIAKINLLRNQRGLNELKVVNKTCRRIVSATELREWILLHNK